MSANVNSKVGNLRYANKLMRFFFSFMFSRKAIPMKRSKFLSFYLNIAVCAEPP